MLRCPSHAAFTMQGIEVFTAAGDLITFACALALLLSPVASVTYSLIIGEIMIASQVCSHMRAAMLHTLGTKRRPARAAWPVCWLQSCYRIATERMRR